MSEINSVLLKLAKARKLVRETPHKKAGRNEYSNFDYYTPEQVEMIVSEVCEATQLFPVYALRRDIHGELEQTMDLYDLETGDVMTFFLATTHGSLKATNETQQMGGTDTYSERYLKMKVFQIKDNNLDFDSKDNRPVKSQTVSDVDDLLG